VICLLQVTTTSDLQVKCNLVNTSAHAFVFSQEGGVHVITIIKKIWLYNKESLYCVILATPLASLGISDCLHVLLMVM
jgi:hypothetical protein